MQADISIFLSLGFSIPFLVMAFFTSKFTWLRKYSNTVMKVGGGIMTLWGLYYFLISLR